ncbi:MAG: transcription termination factor NusA [Candidatus Bipolaricaulaceae bacterium]
MNIGFLEALEEMARERGIDREAAYQAMEKGIAAACQLEYGREEAPSVAIDRRSGDILVDGKPFNLSSLGRIATRQAENVFRQEIVRRRREALYDMYSARVGEILNGSVHRFEGRNVWINLGEAEALLPEEERIPRERYIPGRRLRAYLYNVERTQGDPRVYVSRAHPQFVAKLLALEVPEIEQGLLEVVRVARGPGVRSKVLVRGVDPRIDPVGTCVGAGGVRIRAVSRELAGEKVDIIRWSEDVRDVIRGSLAPASVLGVELDPTERTATVTVPASEMSLAIGRDGQNAELAAKVTDYAIRIQSPSGEEATLS